MMRALTLTQPWCGLVASGIKLVENRPRSMIKPADFGEPFALHASREISKEATRRIVEIAPELCTDPSQGWWRLASITSAVIGVATIDKAITGGWDTETIAEHASAFRYSNGELLGPQQVRWFFGPVGYLLRNVCALETPVPCKGALGFWTLPKNVERAVLEQIEAAL